MSGKNQIFILFALLFICFSCSKYEGSVPPKEDMEESVENTIVYDSLVIPITNATIRDFGFSNPTNRFYNYDITLSGFVNGKEHIFEFEVYAYIPEGEKEEIMTGKFNIASSPLGTNSYIEPPRYIVKGSNALFVDEDATIGQIEISGEGTNYNFQILDLVYENGLGGSVNFSGEFEILEF